MDLDKIKQSWNSINIESLPEENKIQNIIQRNAKTAIDRFYLIEKIGLIAIFPLIFAPCLSGYLPFLDFPVIAKWIYVLFCILGLLWQGYKVSLLHRILKDNTIQSLKRILKYRLCLKFEILAGTLFAFLFTASLLYGWKDKILDSKWLFICITCILFWIIVIALIYFVYRKLFYKQIKEIEQSLQKIKNIEKENDRSMSDTSSN